MRLLPCKSSRCGAFDTAVLAAMTASFSSRTIFHKIVEGRRSRRRWLQKEILLSSASSAFLMKTVQLSPSSQGFGPPRVLSLMSQKCFSILNGPLALCSLPCLLLLRIRSPWQVAQWSHSLSSGVRGAKPHDAERAWRLPGGLFSARRTECRSRERIKTKRYLVMRSLCIKDYMAASQMEAQIKAGILKALLDATKDVCTNVNGTYVCFLSERASAGRRSDKLTRPAR